MWEIVKIISKGDYDYALIPNHPHATKNGYVLLHRAVMENHIERILLKEEVVHHKDKNRKNNSIENLELMTRKEHNKIHGEEQKKVVVIVCAFCGKSFERSSKKINKKSKLLFCSRNCSAKYYWKEGSFRNLRSGNYKANRKSREITEEYRNNMSEAMKKSWNERRIK